MGERKRWVNGVVCDGAVREEVEEGGGRHEETIFIARCR